MTPASQQDYTYNPKPLVVGDLPVASIKGTLITPESRSRGAVLGKIAGAASGAAAAGNTGNGTMGAVTVGAGVKVGVYKAVCIEPAANAGVFAIEDPDGNIVGKATVAVAFAGPVNFTIADGATDFIAGDAFDITVAAGTKYKLSAAAATDGSHVPVGILAEDADATAADVECLIYLRGDFAENALTLGAGHTLASIREGLRARGITLISQSI